VVRLASATKAATAGDGRDAPHEVEVVDAHDGPERRRGHVVPLHLLGLPAFSQPMPVPRATMSSIRSAWGRGADLPAAPERRSRRRSPRAVAACDRRQDGLALQVALDDVRAAKRVGDRDGDGPWRRGRGGGAKAGGQGRGRTMATSNRPARMASSERSDVSASGRTGVPGWRERKARMSWNVPSSLPWQ
jgi:hypothetical protein